MQERKIKSLKNNQLELFYYISSISLTYNIQNLPITYDKQEKKEEKKTIYYHTIDAMRCDVSNP
jgi:hypothetical protein